MQKHLLFCFIFLFIFNCAYAQNIDAYIAAPSGLNLRKTASAKGVVVKKLPYATKLSIIKTTEAKVPYKSKEAEGFYLNGNFVKVLAGKDTGYIFDAFLLPFKPLAFSEIEDMWIDTMHLYMPTEFYFFDSRFKKTGALYDVKKYSPDGPPSDTINYYARSPYSAYKFKQKFDNGNIVLDYEDGYDGKNSGLEVTFTNKNINWVYATVLNYTYAVNGNVKLTTEYSDNTIQIYPEEEGAGCYSTIRVKGITITWEMGCGC